MGEKRRCVIPPSVFCREEIVKRKGSKRDENIRPDERPNRKMRFGMNTPAVCFSIYIVIVAPPRWFLISEKEYKRDGEKSGSAEAGGCSVLSYKKTSVSVCG